MDVKEIHIGILEFEDICFSSRINIDPHPPGEYSRINGIDLLRKKLKNMMKKKEDLPLYMGIHEKIDEAISLRFKGYEVEFQICGSFI